VPFATVPTFTERPQLWQELLEKLGKAYGTGLAHAVAVIGLGGTGKTQLVLRYIEEHEKEYDTVLWIDVRSEETARSSYERCCRTAGLPIEAATSDVPLQNIPAVQAVLSWLRSRGEDKRWLAIVDNADDLSWDVSGIVPKGKVGTVIVTSQDAQAAHLLGGRTPTVKVDAMEPEEAVHLVSKYFDEPVYRGSGCWGLVEEITECLDRLALAMDLAGARVRADVENGDDLATALRQYLTDYRRYQGKLLRDEEFAQVSAYKKTVWTAWETSLASIQSAEDSQSDIYPIQLLSFATMLDRANVQDELFRLASVGLEEACHRLDFRTPAWMRGLLGRGDDDKWDDFSYRATVKLLVRYGLVRPISEPWKGITMHGLVRWRASVGMDREQYWCLYLAFITAVCNNIGEEAENVRFRRHVVVHLPRRNENLGRTDGVKTEGLWKMWAAIGHVLWEEGRWNDAEELEVKVMEARWRVLGEVHPDTLSAMANLASTYRKQGRWKEAEELQVKVMEASSRVLGEEHPSTLTAVGNLAATYRNQGRWKEAEELFVKVMEARSRVLGEEHPDTLGAMGNLASTYWNQGRWKEAEELEVKVMETRSSVLGKEHPSTVTAMANLAATYRKQGRWQEAEELEVKVMEASSRVLGEEHPDTLSAMANLAATYRKQGRWKEAEELEVKVIEARSRVQGEEHPDTLSATANLAATYRKQGRWKEAEELFVKVIEIRSSVLGNEHPSTVTAMANLAATYRKQGRWKEAEELFVKVIGARSRVQGEKHPDTLSATSNLAATYRKQGRWKEAEELFVKVIETRSSVLGEEHPSTVTAMANLAATYRNQGRWKEAEKLEVKVVEASSRVLGEEHPDMLSATANLAATYRKQGRWKEAEELEVKVMAESSRVLGEEHPDTLSAMASLAATYRKQGRWQEAEELFVKVIETRSRVLGEEHPNTLNAMANLAYTKRDLGQSDLAIDLMTRSATISSKVLGYEHPDCRSRNERAALWSSLTTNDDGDGVDWDINQSVHSDGGGCVDV
jgi:tetratricopeptide (TPR) repeat protein